MEEKKKIGEPSPQAIKHAERMIALGWTRERNVDTIAGTWQAGYVACQLDQAESKHPTPAASTPAPAKEQFKMPTDERLIDIAVLFNDGKLEPEKLSDMVGMCRFVLDRLYENNDIMIPSSKENN